jgi:Tat protein translocase TatB subunit
MFDMGFFELLVVFVIALLVLGPERLPKVARKVGYWSGRARATFNNLRYELEREVHNQDMQEKFRRKAKELGIDEASLSGHIEFDPLADVAPSIAPPKNSTATTKPSQTEALDPITADNSSASSEAAQDHDGQPAQPKDPIP